MLQGYLTRVTWSCGETISNDCFCNLIQNRSKKWPEIFGRCDCLEYEAWKSWIRTCLDQLKTLTFPQLVNPISNANLCAFQLFSKRCCCVYMEGWWMIYYVSWRETDNVFLQDSMRVLMPLRNNRGKKHQMAVCVATWWDLSVIRKNLLGYLLAFSMWNMGFFPCSSSVNKKKKKNHLSNTSPLTC